MSARPHRKPRTPLSSHATKAWLLVVLFALSSGWSCDARAEVPDLPSQLVLRFDPSAASLDQSAIREALARELGIPLAESGSAGAPVLHVHVDSGGDLQLTYDPERRRIVRTASLTESSQVPELVAQLAGNMVRDEASQLVSELAPAPASEPANPQSAPCPPAQQAPAQVASPTPFDPEQNPWAVSFWLGGGLRPMEFGVFTVQVSRRLGRFEWGLAVEGVAGRGSVSVGERGGTAGFYGGSGEDFRRSASVLMVNLPISVDFDLLRREQGYLQVGARLGYSYAGAMYTGRTVSGGEGDLLLGVRFTAGIQVRERRTLLLRGTWDILPTEYLVHSGDDTLNVLNLGTSLQLGYAVAF